MRARIAAMLSIGVGGSLMWPYTVDDAFVLGRYARRLAEGLGYTMNDGPATDGVTGPLALIPGYVGERFGLDAVFASKIVGLCAMALAVALVVRRDKPSHVSASPWAVLALAAASPFLTAWGVAGLETGLATLAFTAAALSIDRDSPSLSTSIRPGVVLGVSIAVLAGLRPELAPPAALLLVLSFRDRRKNGAVAIVVAVAGAAVVIAGRLVMFDSPLPLSVLAKPADLAHGVGYVGRGLLVAVGLSLVPLGLALYRGERLAWLIIVQFAAVALAGGDWMPGFRLLVVSLPILALVVVRAIAHATQKRSLRAVCLGVCLIGPLGSWGLVFPEVRAAGQARQTTGEHIADWLEARGGPVALLDVGFLAYRSRVEVIDLGGITDPRVGRLPGGHVAKRIDAAWLEARAPSVILLHSTRPPRVDEHERLRFLSGHPVEHRVAQMPWVLERYRVVRTWRYADSYHYIALVPR